MLGKHYVAQKENVWGLVYGGADREIPVDRGSARQANGREPIQSRLNSSSNNKSLSSLMTLKTEPYRHERDDSQKRIWFFFIPFEKLRKFINFKKYAQKR